ncbi:MAG: hypothetical protein H6730_36895, partial [Deltaproteobacteria bacterium]|nr:hypothetical protein [Deltaproteobacteria bacterium]
MGILGVAALGLAGCGPADAPLPPDKLPETFPVIDSFTASAAAVRPGESVALSWRVRNATEVSINPGLVPSTAQLEGAVQTPALQASVTYTLVAKSAAGDTQRSVVITVVTGKAEIVRFEADPAVLEPGQSTTLYWETTGASGVQVSQVGGAELYAGQDGSGSVAVTPTGSTTYRITVEGDDAGPKTQDAQVLVGAQPRVLRFEPEEAQITEGQGTNLIWQVEGAERVEIRDGAGTMIVDGGPANGQQRVTPAATTTYTLIGTNMVGTAQQSTTVTVLPPGSPRILRFEVTPQALTGPGDVQVSWGTADADTVDLTADGVSVPNFPRTPSGNLSVAVLQDTLLMLVAENDQERTTEMVMVTVGAPDTTPPVIMHTAVGGVLRAGQAVRVEATIVDAETPIGTASLFYRQAGQANFQSVALVDEGSDRYSASIPAAVVMPNAVEYYIQANDSAASPNTARDPAGAPANVHRFMVQPDDQVPPTITVTPVAADQPEGTAVTVSAQVSDSTGVGSVQLYYKRASDALFTSVTMSGSGGSFSASIPAQAVLPPAMEYYLEASDTILPPNVGRSPATAPADAHSFSVVAVDRTPPVVTHTAVANGQVEGTAVTVSAQVTDDSGVGAVTVFYKARGA